MKILKIISRIVLGIVFTFSGFVKSVDPLGSSYKFADYFVDAFGIPELAKTSLVLAIILCAAEFLVGVCLLLNVKPRLASLGALIFMVIFTPLTLYIAIASPVQDCGCFGDAIKLSNWSTFFKNLVLMPLSIFLFIKTKGETNTYKGKLDWILSGAVLACILFFEYYNLAHLPVIDFMPYSVGTNIPDKMVIPQGEKADEYAVFYQMKHSKTGAIKEMSDAEYLKCWNEGDTMWTPVGDGVSKLVKKGYTPPIYNFKAYPVNIGSILQKSQEDVMDSLLAIDNYSFFVISWDLSQANEKGLFKMANVINYAQTKNIDTHLLTSSSGDISKFIRNIQFVTNYYNSDPITLKTMIRSNPGLMLLKKGKIIGKWHYNDVPSIKEFDKIISQN